MWRIRRPSEEKRRRITRWPGRRKFAIDKGCFWTLSPDGTATAHHGLPIDEIERTIRLARARRSP